VVAGSNPAVPTISFGAYLIHLGLFILIPLAVTAGFFAVRWLAQRKNVSVPLASLGYAVLVTFIVVMCWKGINYEINYLFQDASYCTTIDTADKPQCYRRMAARFEEPGMCDSVHGIDFAASDCARAYAMGVQSKEACKKLGPYLKNWNAVQVNALMQACAERF
jgi:hypothetical protein